MKVVKSEWYIDGSSRSNKKESVCFNMLHTNDDFYEGIVNYEGKKSLVFGTISNDMIRLVKFASSDNKSSVLIEGALVDDCYCGTLSLMDGSNTFTVGECYTEVFNDIMSMEEICYLRDEIKNKKRKLDGLKKIKYNNNLAILGGFTEESKVIIKMYTDDIRD